MIKVLIRYLKKKLLSYYLKDKNAKKKIFYIYILVFYIAHLRQRVSLCLFKHSILQYRAPQVVHVYILRNPHTAQKTRRGKLDGSASIVE